MSRTKDPRSDVVAEIREMIEETIDLIQPTPSSAEKARVRSRVSHHVTKCAQGYSLDIMNKYEQASVRALMAWAANEQKAPQETVKAVTEVRFNVDDVTHIQRRDYEDVIKFLIDLRIDELKN